MRDSAGGVYLDLRDYRLPPHGTYKRERNIRQVYFGVATVVRYPSLCMHSNFMIANAESFQFHVFISFNPSTNYSEPKTKIRPSKRIERQDFSGEKD